MSIHLQLQAIVTVLSLINPMVCGTIFARLVAGRPEREKLASATKAVLAILVVLELAALVGAKVLELFGISLFAFSVAGGLILTWMGFSMLRSKETGADDPHKLSADGQPSITPLVLFGASPATITGVITLAVSHAGFLLPITAIVAVAVGCLVTWVTLFLVVKLGTRATGGLVQDTMRAFMGLIIIAMGVQFALRGLQGYFASV
jgi:small neutral amino acid transporter SnatA (MarC family)